MPTPEIIERVRKFNDDLGEVQPDSPHAPAAAELRQHVSSVIAEPEHTPHYRSLSDKLLFHYTGFQIDHPKLAQTMQGIVDSLASVGI